MRSGEGSQPGHPATVPASLQRLRTETSLSPGKQFLLLSEINRGKKDFQIPPCCNDFSPTYSLSSPKIEELFKKRCEEEKKKKELNRGKKKWSPKGVEKNRMKRQQK